MKVQLIAISQLITTLAFGQATPGVGREGIAPFIPLILIFAIFYFLIMRPQQKKAKQHQKFLSELKRGDMIVTNAGIIGVVKTLSDKFVTVEVDDGVCIKMLRSTILESANNLKEESRAKGSLFASPQEEKR